MVYLDGKICGLLVYFFTIFCVLCMLVEWRNVYFGQESFIFVSPHNGSMVFYRKTYEKHQIKLHGSEAIELLLQ